MTQKEWILKQLRRGRRLTRRDAFMDFGVGRLAARIDELRNDGHTVEKDMISVTKANGQDTYVAEYYMPEGGVTA